MKKVKLNYNRQGYSYLKCKSNECFDWGGLAICDSCGKRMHGDVYLIFVLGSAYCEKCFKDWCERSKKYEEDLKLQKGNHIRWYKMHGFKVEE